MFLAKFVICTGLLVVAECQMKDPVVQALFDLDVAIFQWVDQAKLTARESAYENLRLLAEFLAWPLVPTEPFTDFPTESPTQETTTNTEAPTTTAQPVDQ